jgi:hypothetical protein
MDSNTNQARFPDLMLRYVTENILFWQRYGDMLRQLSEGRTSARGLLPLEEIATRDGAEFISNVVRLNLNYWSTLLDIGLDTTDRLFGKAAQARAQPQSATSAASVASTPTAMAAGQTFALEFSGHAGETLASKFVVANKKTKEARVIFEATELVSEDGQTRFRTPIELTPNPFALQPGAEQIVECRLPIDASCVPGKRYLARVRMTGFPDLEIGLIVTPT